MKKFDVKKFMTIHKRGRNIVYGIVLILLVWCVIRSMKENYDSPGPSVGPTTEDVEIDEETKKKVEEKEISQGDLDLVFEMLNST